jgi:outer membrane biosynthesis protein TonB
MSAEAPTPEEKPETPETVKKPHKKKAAKKTKTAAPPKAEKSSKKKRGGRPKGSKNKTRVPKSDAPKGPLSNLASISDIIKALAAALRDPATQELITTILNFIETMKKS